MSEHATGTRMAMTWGGMVWHLVLENDKLACGARESVKRGASWPRFWQEATYAQTQRAPITKICSRCKRIMETVA